MTITYDSPIIALDGNQVVVETSISFQWQPAAGNSDHEHVDWFDPGPTDATSGGGSTQGSSDTSGPSDAYPATGILDPRGTDARADDWMGVIFAAGQANLTRSIWTDSTAIRRRRQQHHPASRMVSIATCLSFP